MDKPHLVFKTDNFPFSLYWYGLAEKQTPNGFTISQGPRNRVASRDVVARFDDDQQAKILVQAIRGAKGEYERRERAARLACEATTTDLIKRATK